MQSCGAAWPVRRALHYLVIIYCYSLLVTPLGWFPRVSMGYGSCWRRDARPDTKLAVPKHSTHISTEESYRVQKNRFLKPNLVVFSHFFFKFQCAVLDAIYIK